ncbi:YcaO-like family protein [Nocardiopsis suaedae]|uniref:YcaO-like family protein n=1 Tax=Nocardiopsis suaedae TaxID=3018444 RepID=A0ABT4TJ12_9ACTN|nr:YcaO-like family protein [Nocardiopsis suaedae]MDA2804674.1 YcaO-like family protein [Nocardiopsis suaedae]
MRSEWVAVAGDGGASPAPAPSGRPPLWPGASERELGLDEARRRIRADIAAQGWRARHRVLTGGDPDLPTAAQCELWAPDGTEVPYGLGSGKGAHAPALVGAEYEAVEHALTGPGILDALGPGTAPAADLAHGPFARDRAVGDLAAQDGARVAVLPYQGLDGGPGADVPLYLWAPWYPVPTAGMARYRAELGDTADYAHAMGYSVNSGCAIGATFDEAALHALNEWVERDAFSLFLLRSVYDGGPMPGTVDPGALPDLARARLRHAEEVVGARVAVLDLTTDLGVPVALAYAPGLAGGAARYYGMGASLSGATAVDRALTEFVQGELLARVVDDQVAEGPRADDDGRPAEHPTFDRLVADHDIAAGVRRRLRGHPRLLACAHLDFADRLAEAPTVGAPPDAVPEGTGVAAQRAAVVERLADAGHRVLARELAVLEHGTTVVQIQCPGLERFHLVTKGHLALPGARGRRLRAAARA